MKKEIIKDQIELALKEINDKNCNIELLYDYLHEAMRQINNDCIADVRNSVCECKDELKIRVIRG